MTDVQGFGGDEGDHSFHPNFIELLSWQYMIAQKLRSERSRSTSQSTASVSSEAKRVQRSIAIKRCHLVLP